MGNVLISRLPPSEQARLLAQCEPAVLKTADVLCPSGQPVAYVFFPTSGLVSLKAMGQGASGVEVGLVGREAIVGTQAALGSFVQTLQARVQTQGAALWLPAAAFRALLDRSPVLQARVNIALSAMLTQLANSAACICFHGVGPRLARCLLMSQDRLGAGSFHLTQDDLAVRLGVRREGVNLAARALQRANVISYQRGELTVLDRAGLEGASCACHTADHRAYLSLVAREPARDSEPHPA